MLVLIVLGLLGLLGWVLASSWAMIKPTLISQIQARPATIPAATQSAAVAAATSSPRATATHSPTPAARPSAPLAAPAPTPAVVEAGRANVTAPAAEGTGRFTLQIGAYQEQAEAEGYLLRMKTLGLEAHIRSVTLPGKGLWHRVHVGRFPTRAAAVQLGQQLTAQKAVTGFVVTAY